MIRAMRDLGFGVFKNLEITSVMDIYKRIKYTERIIRGSELKKYRHIMVKCKESEKGIVGYYWNLRLTKIVSMEKFWTWAKVDAINGAEYLFRGSDNCTYFEKEL